MEPPNSAQCLICRTSAAVNSESPKAWLRYVCDTCGTYRASRREVSALRDGEILGDARQRARISALVRERTEVGQELLLIGDRSKWPAERPETPTTLEELLRDWPTEFGERIDRALRNLGRRSPELGAPLDLQRPDAIPLLFATSDTERNYMVDVLVQHGWVEHVAKRQSRLAAAGWTRLVELSRGRGDASKPAFVAMWFGKRDSTDSERDMKRVYDEGILPAIELAGYRGHRSDAAPHDDFIMMKILGDIRVAPFVVADFTGHRNGVYFEAGFARALGKTVIHTCRRNDFDDAHFDIKQINTIIWDTPEDLYEKLLAHIRGTLGDGPYEVGRVRGSSNHD